MSDAPNAVKRAISNWLDKVRLLRTIAEAAVPLPLIEGETIKEFMDRVSLSAKEWVDGEFPSFGCSVCDAGGNRVVIELWNYRDAVAIETYIVVDYTRNDAGVFTFGTWTEVRKVTKYVEVIDAERQLDGGNRGTMESALRRCERDLGEGVDRLIEEADGLIDEIRSRRSGCDVGEVVEADGVRWRVGDAESIRLAEKSIYTARGRAMLESAKDRTAARLGVSTANLFG